VSQSAALIAETAGIEDVREASFLRDAIGAFRRNRLAMGGLLFIVMLVLLAIFAPLVSPYNPYGMDLDNQLLPASLHHWLGTDNFGRDVLSRLIWGTRIDLMMGFFGVLFPFVIGVTIGAVAGYSGGAIDAVLMRLLDVTISFPFFVLIIAIVATLGPGLGSFYIALALVGWVSYARLVRSQFLVLKQSDFVLAARCLGFSQARIVFKHIMPNAIMPAVVFSMSDAVLDILLGSSLSFLGLGIQPPTAEWGIMIADGKSFIAQAWWISFFPGLAIIILAVGFSLLADGFAELLGAKD
jgi:peptide/nickel transport system permease protein